MPTAAQVSTVTLGGRTFRACQHCAGHLEWTIARLAKAHPGARLVVIQPPWNDGVPESAGTHDKCSAFDVEIVGLDWWAAQKFLRECLWAAFYRWAIAGLWDDHIHMLSIGCPAPVGTFVPGQLADYFARPPRDGLKGHGPDTTWHPADPTRAFDFDHWAAAQRRRARARVITDKIRAFRAAKARLDKRIAALKSRREGLGK